MALEWLSGKGQKTFVGARDLICHRSHPVIAGTNAQGRVRDFSDMPLWRDAAPCGL